MVNKFVAYIYFGCLGIREIFNISDPSQVELIREFSLKYGMLIYLKEELTFLKKQNSQFVSTAEDIYQTFIFYATKMLNSFTEQTKGEEVVKTVRLFKLDQSLC